MTGAGWTDKKIIEAARKRGWSPKRKSYHEPEIYSMLFLSPVSPRASQVSDMSGRALAWM